MKKVPQQLDDTTLWTAKDNRKILGAEKIREIYTESEYEEFLRTPVEGAVNVTEEQVHWLLQKIYHSNI